MENNLFAKIQKLELKSNCYDLKILKNIIEIFYFTEIDNLKALEKIQILKQDKEKINNFINVIKTNRIKTNRPENDYDLMFRLFWEFEEVSEQIIKDVFEIKQGRENNLNKVAENIIYRMQLLDEFFLLMKIFSGNFEKKHHLKINENNPLNEEDIENLNQIFNEISSNIDLFINNELNYNLGLNPRRINTISNNFKRLKSNLSDYEYEISNNELIIIIEKMLFSIGIKSKHFNFIYLPFSSETPNNELILFLNDIFNLIPKLEENEPNKKNPHPEIFTSAEAWECFKKYTENYIFDFYTDYSYLKKRLFKEKLIHRITDNDFIETLHEKIKLINEKDYNIYSNKVPKQLLALTKSYSVNRENNFNIIFENLLDKGKKSIPL